MRQPDPNQTVAEIRDRLGRLLRDGDLTGSAAGQLLQLLGRLDKDIAALRESARSGSRTPGPRKPEAVEGYTVEPGQRGNREVTLCEHRSSGAQPFRCPRSVYDAVAQQLASAGAPTAFADLHRRLKKSLGSEAVNYRVRMCLRCWIREGLVSHAATRFSPTEPRSFQAKARALWEAMAKAGKARH